VLGPVRVFDGDREIDLGGPMSRALVARLALSGGRPVTTHALAEDLWDEAPVDAVNALQSIVSRTRRRLPDGVLVSAAGGYTLRAEVDAEAFRILAGQGRLREALDLWRGEALSDVRDLPFARRLAPGLEEARLGALEQELAARRPGPELIAELTELAGAHPYREGLWALYLRALAGCGRAAEALTAYESLRARLADDLGTDPSPTLRDVHTRILRGELTPDAADSRLPSALTSFVGRDDAVEDLRRALQAHRLVTILGPGGAGKTRLAVETARAGADTFPAVWLAELATVTGADDVVPAVLSAMGLLEVAVLDRTGLDRAGRSNLDRTGRSGLDRTGRDRTAHGGQVARLVEAAADADGLLVLDNCEHLVDAAADIVGRLLAGAPRLRVIATSREALQLIGEFTYSLGPLGLPLEDADLQAASGSSAVRLFVERAGTVDRTFVLDETTLPAVREICRRLDGQPLALELAAARLRTLGVHAVAARLSDRFRLLTGGNRTLPRHRTLRAVVQWSWDLLSERERDLAERIAVFPSGVTAQGAGAVFDDDADAADLLESLAEKSLVVPVRDTRGPARFRMLETLREFGVERLAERGLLEKVRTAHLDHVATLLEEQALLVSGPRQLDAIHRIDAERGNVTAAARFAVDRGDRRQGARLVRAMAFYWAIRNEHEEMGQLVSAVTALPGTADPDQEIALAGFGILEQLGDRGGQGGDWQPLVDRILELWDAHHPDDAMTVVILTVVQFFGLTGDREIPEPADLWVRSVISMMQLAMKENTGDIEGLDQGLADTVAGFRASGDHWGLAASLSLQGTFAAYEGRFDVALRALREAVVLMDDLGADEDAGRARLRLLQTEAAVADRADLLRLRGEFAERLERAGNRPDRAVVLSLHQCLALIDHRLGDDAAALARLQPLKARLDSRDPFGGDQVSASLRAVIALVAAGAGEPGIARQEIASAADFAAGSRDMPVIALTLVAAAVVTERVEGDGEQAVRLLALSDTARGRPDRSDRDAEALAQARRERLGPDRYDALRAEGAALDPVATLAGLAAGGAGPTG